MSTGSQVNVSHSAPKWRGSYSQEGEIVDAHKVRGRGVRGANRGVSFNRRRRRKHFLYEKKRRKGVWNCAAKCKQEELSATSTAGSNVENGTVLTLYVPSHPGR